MSKKKDKNPKIAPQMAPTSNESYHDNYGVTQHMADGGDVDDLSSWHDPATAAALQKLSGSGDPKAAALSQVLGLSATPQPSQQLPAQPQGNQALPNWNDANAMKQRAVKMLQQQNSAPSIDVDDNGYATYRKATEDFADGGAVRDDDDDDSGDDSDNEDDLGPVHSDNPAAIPVRSSNDNSINFNLSNEDTKALTDYLDADKQRQAKMNAIQQMAQVRPNPAADRIMQGMAAGTIGGPGKDILTEMEPSVEAAAVPAFQKIKNMLIPSSVATPEAVQAQKQVVNNLMEQHEGAYWHPAVKQALQKLNEMIGR